MHIEGKKHAKRQKLHDLVVNPPPAVQVIKVVGGSPLPKIAMFVERGVPSIRALADAQ